MIKVGRLGRDVQDAGAVRCAAHGPVGDAHHVTHEKPAGVFSRYLRQGFIHYGVVWSRPLFGITA